VITFDAHFDGEALRPEAPVALPKNVRLRVTVVESEAGVEKPDGDSKRGPFRDIFAEIEAEHGLIEGPPDWSAELDHYLYGTPKRGNGRET
jgi:hypothetical protein